MAMVKKVLILLIGIFALLSVSYATQEQILIELNEFVDQEVIYNPLKFGGTGVGTWSDANENQSSYSITGYVVVSNTNPNGKTLSDIYISLDNTNNMTLPVLHQGRNGTFISNNPASNLLVLHIPELMTGENSTWVYSVNTTSIRPPLNFTSTYSDSKVLAGDNVTIYDRVENVYDNETYQLNTCIYGINVSQTTVPVNFSGLMQDYFFFPISTAGSDATNVTYPAAYADKTQHWSVLGGGNSCLDKGASTDIEYIVSTPLNIPKTTDYTMLNTTLKYNLNSTISHTRVIDIVALSEAYLDFEKKILKPSHPTLYGSNVTWNVTGYFATDINISYVLEEVTLWVSQRNVNGIYTDPNTVDNDTIATTVPLTVETNPFVVVNTTSPWSSSNWLFNYSDIPSPIVWMDINFSIDNDGTQLINRSITKNGRDIYIKEIYLIIGYWLEINKNITAISDDEYHVRIDVHNKGNQVTPADTIVTIYDFIPGNYNLTGPFVFSNSPWYTTANTSNNISGIYNGTLHQWGLVPTGVGGLNTSFAQGPGISVNTSWSADYNVTGIGDYTLLDIFITGLDPQKVDGAGSTNTVIVTEVMDRLKSTEGIFAAVASVLLLLGLLL
ncbi:MAG: hypothetical protein PF569_03380 [Candidatus Woesearchaeota archaeon]|jgi:hypothetical protein|nr:hypothetical protein [Candidatus Woesearchaeota archaeon]